MHVRLNASLVFSSSYNFHLSRMLLSMLHGMLERNTEMNQI